MEPFDRFTLCDERTERVCVQFWVEYQDCRFTFSRLESGAEVLEEIGTDDYQVWIYFDVANTERLIRLLTAEGDEIKKALLDKFNGLHGYGELCAFCDENDVTYKGLIAREADLDPITVNRLRGIRKPNPLK